MSGIIIIGSSNVKIKTIVVDTSFKNNVYTVNKYNWICDDIYNDTFEITIHNGICTCVRTDAASGWGMNLMISSDIIVDHSKLNKNVPIFFINLKKDNTRLWLMKNMLYNIFDNNNIYRVEGVTHKIGLEGCRLAHMNAHVTAINKGFQYYIVAEDDIKPLVETTKIVNYIHNSIALNPDIVLFELGPHLELKIQLSKTTENMYRIYGGGNNAGCYLCSRKMGIKLINHWMKNVGKHIDHSWQELWGSTNVYLHRPQLFHQREGYSNQSDVVYRETAVPFNWDLYEIKKKG
jgi:hypothetical protein